MLGHLLYAFRTLHRELSFTVAAVATLALGTGATTAVFSAVSAALVRPLPYTRVQDIRVIGTTTIDGRPTTGGVAPMELARLRSATSSIVKVVAATNKFDATMLGQSADSRAVSMAFVGEGFFDLFGLPMAQGRAFSHDESIGNGPAFVILSYELWRTMFGADPEVVGRSVQVLEFGRPLEVIGVAARDFDVPHDVDAWLNLRMDLQAMAGGALPGAQDHTFDGYVRLQPGTTAERLRSELGAVMAGVAQDAPPVGRFRVYTVRTLVEAIIGDLGPMLLLILCAAVVLLLLSCVNVTNLLLVRNRLRMRDFGIRMALGAGSVRMVRHLLAETVLLASSGSVLGLLLAYALVQGLQALGLARLPRLESIPFDPTVMLFVFGAMATAATLVGALPACQVVRSDIRSLLNDSGRGVTGGSGQRRLLTAMTVVEVALAVVLLSGAGALLRSFANLRQTDPGFLTEGRLVVDVAIPFARYSDPMRVAAWSQAVEDRLRAIGAVTAVGSSNLFPLRAGRDASAVTYLEFAEQPNDPNQLRPVRSAAVSPGYFDAMGIGLLRGRQFTVDDRPESTAVAVVNRSFQRRYLPDRDPLGIRFATGYPTVNRETTKTIVGVVNDVKYRSLAEAVEPMFYTPQGQTPFWRHTIVVATSLGNTESLVSQVRAAVSAGDAQLPLRIESMSRLVSESIVLQRLGTTLMVTFAVSALVLSFVGIYGVIAYTSAERGDEIAIRQALGATPLAMFLLIVKEGRVLLLGLVAGLSGAYLSGRLVSSQLYHVEAADPLILGTAVVLVLGITAVAIVVAGRNASRVDPVHVLRLR